MISPSQDRVSIRFPALAGIVAALMGLACLGAWTLPLFHGVVEVLTLCLIAAIFALSWETRDLAKDLPLVSVTRGYVWVALAQAAHVLTYPGLPVTVENGDLALSMRFWFMARLLESLLFLSLALPWPVAWGWRRLMGATGGLSALLLVVVLWPEPWGLWLFSVKGGDPILPWREALPIMIDLLSLALLARPARKRPAEDRRGPMLVITLMAACQTFFLGPDLAGPSSVIPSHLLMLGALGLLYRSAARVHLAHPLDGFVRREEQWRDLEERLTEERNRAERYLDIAQVIIIGLDRDGRIALANPHARAVLGWPEERLIDADWFDLALPPQERDSVRAAFKGIIAGRVASVEFQENDIVTRDGTVLRVAWHNTVTRDPRGAIVGTLSSGQDVTARKRAQDALMAAKEAAEDASRMKSDFLASISHELRTPLNAVIGFSEAMEAEIMGPLENPTYRDYVSNIRVSAAHLLDLINDILDVSTIEAGKLDLRVDRVDPNRVIQVALDMIRVRAEAKGLILAHAPSPKEPIHLIADERRVRQMVVNLLGNAVKFTPKGGTVSLTFEPPMGEMALGLSVIDTGPGMSPTELELAMRPFGRVIDPNVPWREGTGLGLPLVEGLIQAHGGRLEVDTVPGRGTRATLWFPRERVLEEDRATG